MQGGGQVLKRGPWHAPTAPTRGSGGVLRGVAGKFRLCLRLRDAFGQGIDLCRPLRRGGNDDLGQETRIPSPELRVLPRAR